MTRTSDGPSAEPSDEVGEPRRPAPVLPKLRQEAFVVADLLLGLADLARQIFDLSAEPGRFGLDGRAVGEERLELIVE
jgi:hypothetical protein